MFIWNTNCATDGRLARLHTLSPSWGEVKPLWGALAVGIETQKVRPTQLHVRKLLFILAWTALGHGTLSQSLVSVLSNTDKTSCHNDACSYNAAGG